MSWQVKGRELKTPGGAVTSFALDIGEVVEVDDVLVVTLKVPPGHTMTENVFGISKNGGILWQIERVRETSTDPLDYYVGVTTYFKNTVSVANYNGQVASIDVLTGKIVNIKWLK